MASVATIVLRDIHQPAAPGWWPPAPGWWLLGLVILACIAALWGWQAWRRRRRRRIEVLFDSALANAGTPAERLAVMSQLLRRAARRHDPAADRLQGDAWRARLDAGVETPRFEGPLGDVLLEGGFRPDPDPDQVEAVRQIARVRFIEWMASR